MKVKINGLVANYQQIGQAKQLLVMLHGWGCDWQIFAAVIPELSKKFTLIVPDLPCFGESSCPKKAWNSLEYAAWLEEFLDQVIGARKFSLLGHSFGAKIAAVWTAGGKHAGLEQLILVDAAGLPDPLTKTQLMTKLMAELVPFGLKSLVKSSFKRRFFTKLGVGVDHLSSTPEQQKVLRLVVRENIADRLVKIKVPTLLIWGRHDQATPIHQAEKFHQLIAQSKIKILENSDHFPFLCEPAQFAQLIVNTTKIIE